MKKVIQMLVLCLSHSALCQSADYPLNHPAYTILDKAAATSEGKFFTKIKPYNRKSAIEYLQTSQQSDFSAKYLYQDSREWSGDSTKSRRKLGRFFQFPSDVYSATSEGFDLHINPVVHARIGQDSRLSNNIFENSRGLEVRALIDDRIALYTMITENQALFPAYINEYRDSLGVLPQEGFWKLFREKGSDFLRAEGYVDVGVTDHVSIQMGYGRHFIGDGQRSLILSDFGNRYPYVRIETEVWKIKYTNLFAQLVGKAGYTSTGTLGAEEFPQKFLAMHHLDINVTDKLNIGFFESIVFGEPDSLGGGVKLQYLNPIIFYRALEQQDGSPDNALLGMDFNWHIWNRITLYGQLVIDELVVKDVFSKNGSWKNKQGIQFGAKYFDAFGVKDLMLQGELNAVRPYTYSHQNFFTNYAHYNMPLAHPLGANFEELVGKVDFRPFDKWRLQMVGVYSRFGDDIDGENFGRDILRSYTDRDKNGNGRKDDDYGNAWLQGQKGSLKMINLRATYHWKPNLMMDGDFILRKETGQTESQSTIFGLSLRWNFPERFYLF